MAGLRSAGGPSVGGVTAGAIVDSTYESLRPKHARWQWGARATKGAAEVKGAPRLGGMSFAK